LNIQAIYDNLEYIFEAVDSPYTFDKPALFIRAGNSDYILPDDYGSIKKTFTSAQFHTIEGASHWVHAEKPDELCDIFNNFI